tara:strand:+ start:4949 stop:5350 length:402 start_codon:yes stop_codon:yes gene_type:complete
MTIEYNEKNLKMVSDAICNNLSEDMLPKKWIERNKTNPMFGHCHTASGCLQKIFGTKTIKMHRALDDENIYHWWCVDINGTVIDLTAKQYTDFNRNPPYENGTKMGMLGFGYRKRVLSLLDKVTYDLGFQPGW